MLPRYTPLACYTPLPCYTPVACYTPLTGQARAKAELREEVTEQDAYDAVEIVKVRGCSMPR